VTSPTAADGHAAHIRTRLIVWMLVAVGVAVLLLGVPLAALTRQWAYSVELSELRQQAEFVESVLDDRPPEQLATSVGIAAMALDARLSVLDADGRVFRDSMGVAAGTRFTDPVVRSASLGSADARVLSDQLVAAIRGDVGGTRVIIRLARSDDAVAARVGSVWLAIAALGLTALVAGAVLASWRARQLAEPLEALATSAGNLGQGDFSERAPRSGVVEIDRIAGALDATADRLRAALRRSASFTADASHQLRTPLTALRLDIEALAAEIGTAHPLLDAAEAEVDRLDATITELLELADAAAEPGRVDLRALVLERLDAWRTLADAAGRAVRVTREPVPAVRARPGAVGQALQVLLDNALVHGRGDVTVWLEAVSRQNRSWVRLCVGDEGEGVRPEELYHGSGRGLSLARSLIDAEGGRVVVDEAHGNRVCLLLPSDGEPPVDRPEPVDGPGP
jgi:signal transduction histidine kinase